jgi:hypothetical protein
MMMAITALVHSFFFFAPLCVSFSPFYCRFFCCCCCIMSFALPLSCTVEGNRLIPTRHEVRKETAEGFFFLARSKRKEKQCCHGRK